MSSTDTQGQIERGVTKVIDEVPAFRKLKLVFGLALRAKSDVQIYRVELPKMEISKGIPQDARIEVFVQRATFNEIVEKGTVADWQAAFESGAAHASGPPEMLQLIATVVERHQQRSQLRPPVRSKRS